MAVGFAFSYAQESTDVVLFVCMGMKLDASNGSPRLIFSRLRSRFCALLAERGSDSSETNTKGLPYSSPLRMTLSDDSGMIAKLARVSALVTLPTPRRDITRCTRHDMLTST